jgi:hypothetical protein
MRPNGSARHHGREHIHATNNKASLGRRAPQLTQIKVRAPKIRHAILFVWMDRDH